ncbi:hypothetical protein BH23BAC1_BH23BAC1_35760 [soil metagenome]
MLRKRSVFLFVILIALMGITLVLTSIEEQNQGFYDEDSMFAINDVSKVDRVVLKGSDFRNELIRERDNWRIQRKYFADPEMVNVLLTALNEVRVRRPAPRNLAARISNEMDTRGVEVEVYSGKRLISSFVAGGDEEKRDSYFSFSRGGEPMMVYLPGYNLYVSGIFELKENEWRDRVVFNSNWTTLQSLEVTYPQDSGQNFQILFQNDFFTIPEVSSVDTAKMMAYIELYNYIEVENYAVGEKFPALDSIRRTTPLIQIKLKDLNDSKSNTLLLYRPLDDNQTTLGVVGEGQLAVFKYPKIQNLLKTRRDFNKN